MLAEQDLRDREQIGLFGVKKNSEIMGVNQHAVSNNLDRVGSPAKAASKDGRSQWGVPNKNVPYEKVVKEKEMKNTKHSEAVQ